MFISSSKFFVFLQAKNLSPVRSAMPFSPPNLTVSATCWGNTVWRTERCDATAPSPRKMEMKDRMRAQVRNTKHPNFKRKKRRRLVTSSDCFLRIFLYSWGDKTTKIHPVYRAWRFVIDHWLIAEILLSPFKVYHLEEKVKMRNNQNFSPQLGTTDPCFGHCVGCIDCIGCIDCVVSYRESVGDGAGRTRSTRPQQRQHLHRLRLRPHCR